MLVLLMADAHMIRCSVQATFDLRQPSHPLRKSLWAEELVSPLQSAVSFGITRNVSWVKRLFDSCSTNDIPSVLADWNRRWIRRYMLDRLKRNGRDAHNVVQFVDLKSLIKQTHLERLLDLFAEFRHSESSNQNDSLDLKQAAASLMSHRGKLGVAAIKFRPDSRLACLGCWDSAVRLYDVVSKQPLETLK